MATHWKKNWQNIEDSINEKINKEMSNLCNKQQNKLISLKKAQQKQENREYHKFYTQIRKLTTIQLAEKENKLLNKELQYNLHYKKTSNG
jgi:hypothetical protein